MVYVDSLNSYKSSLPEWKYGRSCHLFADSEEELLEFARKIGLEPGYIQRTSLVHFDLTAGKRVVAVRNGAEEADSAFVKSRLKNVPKRRDSKQN